MLCDTHNMRDDKFLPYSLTKLALVEEGMIEEHGNEGESGDFSRKRRVGGWVFDGPRVSKVKTFDAPTKLNENDPSERPDYTPSLLRMINRAR